jgi:choline dehydrogenase-like flavoprotein
MFYDTRKLAPDTVVRCDLCVIGGGAAGISIAREFLAEDRRVCVLEAGGSKVEAPTQQLYAGEVTAESELVGDYLQRSRLRYFGGSTNHWNGYCRPLDEFDLTPRAWVPDSGWPLTRRDLDPWYPRASELCEIPPVPEQLPPASAPNGRGALPFPAASGIASKLFHVSPPTRFGARYRDELRTSKNVRVYLYANATRLRVHEESGRIRDVAVATLTGVELRVVAKVFVLATGAIENARLLLHSRLGGLAVGRYFMEHVGAGPGRLVLSRPLPSMALYLESGLSESAGLRAQAVLCLAPELQREHRLLNASFKFESAGGPPGAFSRALAAATGDLDRWTEAEGREVADGCCETNLVLFSETAPIAENRVTITDEVDPLGVPRTRLHWKASDADQRSFLRSFEVLAQRLGMCGEGRLQLPTRQIQSPLLHPAGTTRMGISRESSVTTDTGRLHDVENLFVAGSSLFPTVGFANPTLTIVALALRQAAELRRQLDRSS